MTKGKTYTQLRKVTIILTIVLLLFQPYHLWEAQGSGNIIPESELQWIDNGDGTATITNYTGEEKHNLIIPGTVGGLTVVAITRNGTTTDTGFQNKGLAGSITIPGSVTSIGRDVFRYNQLTNVVIPPSVSSIGIGAFANNQLTSVVIPNSVTSIGNAAFYWNRLMSVDIPSSVTSIGDGVFYYNHLTSVAIPNSVTSIGKDAFRFNLLTSVDIPGSVTSIGDYAFENNRLTSVVIPGSVTNIGDRAFENNQLTSVVIPGSVTSIGDYAFDSNQLTYVAFLRDGVWNMGLNVFGFSPYLQHIYGYLGSTAQTNIQTASKFIDIRGMAPTLSPSLTDITNQDVIVTINYPPNMTNHQYRINGEEWTSYTGPVSKTENGTVEARYTNIIGTFSPVGSLTISNIDKIAPTITLSQSPTTPTNQNVLVTATITDNVGISERKWASGKQAATYFSTGGTVFTGSFIVIENGTYTVYARDTAGNTAVQTITISNINRTTPTLSVDYTPTDWTNQDVRVDVMVSEVIVQKWARGNHEAAWFSTDGNGMSLTDHFIVTENDSYTIYVRDEAGNEKIEIVTISIIDKDPPLISLFATPLTLTNESVTVTADVITINSPIAELKWAYGNQTEDYFLVNGEDFSYAFQAVRNGVYTVYARDAAGNTQLAQITVNNIYREEPLITLTISPSAPTRENVSVMGTVDANQDIAVQKYAFGLHEASYFLDHGDNWMNEPIEVTENGWITFYVRDIAGNVAVEILEIRNIDRVQPVITLKGEAAITLTQGGSFIDPGATAIDNLDGDISSLIVVIGEVATSQVGEYILTYQVTDRAGNLSDPVMRVVKVTLTPSHGGGGGGGGSYTPPSEQPQVQPKPIPTETEPNEEVTPSMLFNDIMGHWASAEILELVSSGLIEGYPDRTFKPNDSITRAEFVAIIIRALGLEVQQGKIFNDTRNHWARDVIATAHANGIINGYDDTSFGANDPITREQMASIIVAAFGLEGGQGTSFADDRSISEWARTAVEIASEQGIITGYTDGAFRPRNHATRAEAVIMMARVLSE